MSRVSGVLVVDDDKIVADSIARALRRNGLEVEVVHDGKAAIDRAQEHYFDVMVLDFDLGSMNAIDVLRQLALSASEPPPVLVLSGAVNVARTVELMRLGVRDVLEKPISPTELTQRIRSIIETEAQVLPDRPSAPPRTTPALWTDSRPMQNVLAVAERVARSTASCVLISGESGVGKNMLAARIHERSDRADRPFLHVNLATIPDAMVETELFGAAAVPGATPERAGVFARADGGTLLLDEISNFRYELQAKLLHVCQEHRFRPVGAEHERTTDVRVIATTNRSPHEAIASRALREDLFYRISVVTMTIPPLRERPEDILPLAQHFIRHLASSDRAAIPALTPAAQTALVGYPWPGNVRQLRNVIERALMFCGEALDVPDLDLPLHPDVAPPGDDVVGERPAMRLASGTREPETLADARNRAVEEVERAHIQATLASVHGNQSKAARLLGISRSTLWEKMRRYGL